MASDKEPFLARWSRRKLADDARAPEPAPPPARPAETSPPPELPPIDQLNFDSNYKDFLHPKVDEGLRRQALKKLFASAHFQTPDMMDDFNEDYTKLLEPLAPGVAEKLAHAKRTLLRGEAEPEPTAKTEAPREVEAPREDEAPEPAQDVARSDAPSAARPAGDDGAPG